MLSYLALLLALAALAAVWTASRKNSQLKERIAQTNSRVYHLRRELQEALDKAEQDRLALKLELLRLKGDLKITPDMKISEVLALHPQAQQVLAGFHIGGCAGCSVDSEQSLGEAVTLNGRDLAPILAALNTLVADDNGRDAAAAERLKAPNVELRF